MMKLFSIGKVFMLAASLFILSCSKETTAPVVNEPLPMPGPTGQTPGDGNFVSNVHPTSGKVSYKIFGSKRYLVFENFKTDNGPDLRVFLSKATNLNDAQEVAPLKAVSGNFSYELSSNHDPVNYNHVLIWCVPFRVLFGHAVLD